MSSGCGQKQLPISEEEWTRNAECKERRRRSRRKRPGERASLQLVKEGRVGEGVKKAKRERRKSVAAGIRRMTYLNALKLAVEFARAATKVLLGNLIKERASRKESEKEW